MNDLDKKTIAKRLQALYSDLEVLPPDAVCSWPVSRVFNELLKQARREVEDDPVVAAISVLPKPAEGQDGEVAHVATVRALVGQLIAALTAEQQGSRAQGKR